MLPPVEVSSQPGPAGVEHVFTSNGLPNIVGEIGLTRHVDTAEVTSVAVRSTIESRAYSNSFGEPIVLSLLDPFFQQVFRADYTRDALGRIERNIETVGNVTRVFEYGYDPAGRLRTVQRDGTLVVLYTYDANGNRLRAEGEQAPADATYDDQDRLLTYGANSYTYGPTGELASRTRFGQTTEYEYDSLGNLVRVLLPDGRVIRYAIDGRGRRVAKYVDDVRVRGWLYADQLRPIAELDGTGAVISRFVYASRSNVPDSFTRGGDTYRLFADHLGSPRVTMNASTGEIGQRMDFGPFGERLQDSNPGFQPFGFAGGLYVPDTGLVRFGARDYDPETGRWTAKDPIGFAGGDSNLYGYVVADPINLIDPRGLDWTVSIGVNVTAGANLGLGIPFLGGGLSFGLNVSTGQLFIQATANATVGAGAFAGVGLEGSVEYSPAGDSCSSFAPRLHTSNAAYAQANAE